MDPITLFILFFLLSFAGNVIFLTALMIQKSKIRLMDHRYANLMEELTRVRANYNQLKNQENQEQ